MLLALGGQKEPNLYKSVHAYDSISHKWSYISTLPHECYQGNTAAIAIPQIQELILVQAKERLLMKGRVQGIENKYLHDRNVKMLVLFCLQTMTHTCITNSPFCQYSKDFLRKGMVLNRAIIEIIAAIYREHLQRSQTSVIVSLYYLSAAYFPHYTAQ